MWGGMGRNPAKAPVGCAPYPRGMGKPGLATLLWPQLGLKAGASPAPCQDNSPSQGHQLAVCPGALPPGPECALGAVPQCQSTNQHGRPFLQATAPSHQVRGG